MNLRRLVAVACLALLASTLAAQVPAPPAAQEDEFLKGAYLSTLAGVRAPAVVREVTPHYTHEAMHRNIAGDVVLQVVVGIDGNVERARITRSLDDTYGLDASALRAASQWKFKPGTLDGTTVPVVVTLELSFRFTKCSNDGCFEVPAQPEGGRQKPSADEEFLKDVYLTSDKGVRPPQVVREVKPSYTAEAMRHKIQGEVEIQAVVGLDGRVVRARVTKSLDTKYGLDASALKVVSQWTFAPGTLNGAAVLVAVTVNIAFMRGD